MPQTVLTPTVRDQIARLGSADIMVGIPSFKNAATIGYVVRAAQAGLVQYFPDLRPVVVNSDAGSPDGTARVVSRPSRPTTSSRSCSPVPTTSSSGSASPTPRSMASAARARRCARSSRWPRRSRSRRWSWSTPTCARSSPSGSSSWPGPILKGGYDFVAPLYARYKYDGTITNTVTYPLTRALYGHRIRQPIGGDFGVSGDLVRHYLSLDDWTDDVSKFGIDIWMTTSALTGGFAVCQTRLGAKIHDPKDPGSDLGPMFRQVVGTILRLAVQNADALAADPRQPRGPGVRLRADDRPAAARGEHAPPPVGVPRRLADARRQVERDALEGDRSRSSWTSRPRRAGWVTRPGPSWASAATSRRPRRPRSRWPRRSARSTSPTTSGRASSTTSSSPPATRSHPLETFVAALVPIYFGRVGSFVIENRHITTEQAEERVERQAREFELLKPYLVERWNAVEAAPRVSAASPLPARILIPVANPGTAEELIRLGAAMLDPRAGELSALGIVEVPEGMPLSEGATRARHARRLLQKVLDYAPNGTPIHPIVRIGRHAAEGIIEAAAEQEADLIIFGWGGKAPAGRDGRNGSPTVFSPTIDEVVRESPCDIAVVKQRGAREIKRVLVPVRGGPHAELAMRFADAIADLSQGHGRGPPPRAAGDHDGGPRPGGTGARRVHQAAPAGQGRGGPARGPERPQRDPARGREGRPRRDGRLGRARRRRRRLLPVRGAPRGDRRAREADRRGRQDPRGHRPARRSTPLASKAESARRRRPRRRGGPRRPGPGRALVRRIELPPRRVRRPAPPRPAQGEAGRHGLAGAPDAQRGGDDRADRAQGDPRDGRPRAAARRDPRHRLRLDRPDPRDRRGRRRPRRPAPRRADSLRLVPGQGRGALEVALRDQRRHRRLGRHRRPQLAPPHGLRDARAAPPRAAAAVRQGLLPAPDRRGRRSSRRAAAGASRSSWPDR